MRAGKSCKLGHSDVRSAFRNLGIRKSQWRFLLMKARSPLDGKWYYFVDKCLPFGASISCAHFQKVSNVIAHVVKAKTRKDLVNYLDNFLFVALIAIACNRQLETFLQVCSEINFPVSDEKTFWAATSMIFLGLLINTVTRTVSILVEKILKAKQLIETMLSKASKKITVNQLQKLCGFLNFLCRSVLPGRAFTQRLYANLGGINTKTILKPHHHLRITAEMRADLQTWLIFLKHLTMYCRQFMDFDKTWNAEEISFYSDASRSKILGFGAICETSWMAESGRLITLLITSLALSI